MVCDTFRTFREGGIGRHEFVHVLTGLVSTKKPDDNKFYASPRALVSARASPAIFVVL